MQPVYAVFAVSDDQIVWVWDGISMHTHTQMTPQGMSPIGVGIEVDWMGILFAPQFLTDIVGYGISSPRDG